MKVRTEMIAGVVASLMMVSSANASLSISGKYFGVKGDADMVSREIVVTSQTKWISVGSGDTVKIIDAASGKSVVWLFDTNRHATGYLSSITPDMANGRLTIYVKAPPDND